MANYPSKLDARALGLLGVKALVYPISLNGSGVGAPKGVDIPVQQSEVPTRLNTGTSDADKLSYLGTPVFSDLILKADDQSTGLQIDTVLFDVSMSKNIVKTSIPGRNGTVKEYVNDGDYSISIRGILVSSVEYPIDEVNELTVLLKEKKALIAISPFLQLFGIYEIVVESYRIPQIEGFQNMQPFELECVSDVPIELVEEDV